MFKIFNNSSGRIRYSAPIKVHEIIFIWLLVMFGWSAIFENFGGDIDYFIYLKWAAISTSMIVLSKHFVKREGRNFAQLLGRGFSRRALVEMIAVTIACVCLGIGCWAVLVLLSAQIDMDWAFRYWHFAVSSDFNRGNWTLNWIVINAITTSILGPIVEEIVFRGFVLRRLQEKHSVGIAIKISSLIFGFFHLNNNFLGSSLHGVIYALVAIKFSSLYAPIFVHVGYNAIIFFMEKYYGFFLTAERTRIGSIDYWLPELALLAIGMTALVCYSKMCLRSQYTASLSLVSHGGVI
ncbi:CPBP family intramembrane metalloprotease [Massilia sp. P8910]|uniref:CPBP family intramembrane glutamic endopeptidase n=1 Tax=Massilia antarctica TaxID=2765360 RepID=UPI001E6347E3|nr:CPBP family intramembrane glutamic endopeptidase [Massilia antarctica]MCE3607421.1 CPBP family intramembrane metalloprotease [Massilia antarctica]